MFKTKQVTNYITLVSFVVEKVILESLLDAFLPGAKTC